MRARWIFALVVSGLLALACSSNDGGQPEASGNTPLCGDNPVAAAAAPVTTCPDGFANCNQDPADGCEADVRTDLVNCGGCGFKCGTQNAAAACTAGVCSIACTTGFTDCNKSALDGCEVHTDADPANCGGCGKACSTVNGVPSCAAGACAIACNPGFGNCDGVIGNGCESDTTSSIVNCGSCGNVCASFNGTATCTAGTCTLACATGFGDCDKNGQNGCESDLRTDTANCGACGNACAAVNGTASCAAGACVLRCNPGFADCDGNPSNGCESAQATDLANCGGCGNVCGSQNSVSVCAGGTCTLHCSPGYGDCDNQAANGCERDLTSDNANCGACGRVCPNPTTCVNNMCQ